MVIGDAVGGKCSRKILFELCLITERFDQEKKPSSSAQDKQKVLKTKNESSYSLCWKPEADSSSADGITHATFLRIPDRKTIKRST